MNIKSLSIKEKIFYAFLLYSFVCFSISVTSFVLFREIEKIDKAVQLVSHLKSNLQLYIRLDNEFLIYEIINPEYYRTGKSSYLSRQDSLVTEINKLSDSISESEKAYGFQIEEDIKTLKELYLSKEQIRREIARNIFLIGFKDYGHMGEMRKAAHYIEKAQGIDMQSHLMIRRHEKDYFLRNDSSYLVKHQKEMEVFRKKIQSSPAFSSDTREALLIQHDLYKLFFDKIVTLEKHTGYKDNSGLTYEMKHQADKIELLINSITNAADQRKIDIVYKIQMVIVAMVTLSIVLLLLLAASFNLVVMPPVKK